MTMIQRMFQRGNAQHSHNIYTAKSAHSAMHIGGNAPPSRPARLPSHPLPHVGTRAPHDRGRISYHHHGPSAGYAACTSTSTQHEGQRSREGPRKEGR